MDTGDQLKVPLYILGHQRIDSMGQAVISPNGLLFDVEYTLPMKDFSEEENPFSFELAVVYGASGENTIVGSVEFTLWGEMFGSFVRYVPENSTNPSGDWFDLVSAFTNARSIISI